MSTVYGYGDEQTSAEALEWLRKQNQASRPAIEADQQRALEHNYVRPLWNHIATRLAPSDGLRRQLILRSIQVGTTAERAQLAADVRHALAVHGPAGLVRHMREQATLLANHPAQDRRATMLWCLAEAIEPERMSDEYKQLQRRHWGLQPEHISAPGAPGRPRTRPRR